MKNSTKGYFILGILFAVISIAAFAVPTPKTATFWVAYAFTTVAFAVQIPIWKVTLGRGDNLKSKFLGLPALHIGICYLILQIVVFAVFLFVPAAPVWIAVIVCVVMAGIPTACMIAADAGRGEIQRVEAGVQAKTFYIKSLQADVELLANQEPAPDTKAALSKLAQIIRFSDPMSHEQLAELEAQIAAKVLELKSSANKADIVVEIRSLLEERKKMQTFEVRYIVWQGYGRCKVFPHNWNI